MRVRLLALAVVALAIAPPVQAQSQEVHNTMAVSAAPTIPTISPVTAPVSDLLGPVSMLFAFAGATARKNTRRLGRAYLFNGVRYGPGEAVEVPDDFPEIDDKGDIVHRPGSAAERNQRRARVFSSPPNTGGVNTGENRAGTTNTVSGKSTEELESMTKGDLEDLAVQLGVEVTRKEGDGEPLKEDYVRTLGKTRK